MFEYLKDLLDLPKVVSDELGFTDEIQRIKKIRSLSDFIKIIFRMPIILLKGWIPFVFLCFIYLALKVIVVVIDLFIAIIIFALDLDESIPMDWLFRI